MKSQEQFVEEMKSVNPDIEILGKYTGTHNKIPCKCKKCGGTWEGRPHDLLCGHGCPPCSYVKRGMRIRNGKDFYSIMQEIHPEIEILSEYQKRHNPITVKCSRCNNIWTTTPGSLLKGSGCPECAKKTMGRHRITEAEFIKRLEDVHPTIKLEGGFISFSRQASFSCSICGNKWEDIPQQLLKHKGCPRCVKEQKRKKATKSKETFCAELYKINPNISVLGEYLSAQSKIRVKCTICGHEWSQKPNNLLNGNGCPNCAHAGTSYIEQLIRLSFSDCVGSSNVISRDRKTIGIELDIYIPTINTAIEYGAWVWHKEHLEKDIEKHNRCQKKGIRLIRIYDACGNDKSALGTDVYLFEKSLTKTLGQEKVFISWLFSICNQPFLISEQRFLELKDTAYKLSRRKTTESFQEELKTINPFIIVTGEYQYDNIKIPVECVNCGYKWSATPSNLLRGWGCPRCSKKLKRTQEQFISEMAKKHTTIRVLGEYVSSNKPVKCECTICGYIWSPQPAGLLNQNHGCPKCSGRLKWTHQEFVDKLKEINPNITILGTYKNSATNVQCKCNICGYIWNPIPHNLVRGSGCPKCRTKK